MPGKKETRVPEEERKEEKDDKKKKVVKTEEEILAEENLEFVKRVLDDEAEINKGITRAFRTSKKEQLAKDNIANAERFDPEHLDGLTSQQVMSRKEKLLTNQASHNDERTIWNILYRNIFTFFNLLIIVVASALIYVGAYQDLFFVAIMVINTSIGIFQEVKAKRTVGKLSIISAPVAIVVRDKERYTVPTEDIVLDDIMFLENGKQICADGIVKKGKIEVNESLLTGESALVSKTEGDKLYAGSFVSSGSCYARADKIGNANYIQSLTSFAKKYKKGGSELLRSLKRIIFVIGILVVPIAILMFNSNYNYFNAASAAELGEKSVIYNTITRTAGAIIGMIPSGMFLLTSIALFVCISKLARNRVLVQDMYCIEMLARTNILCLDKTGTITDGTMRVSEVINFRLGNNNDYTLNDIVGSILTATGDNNQTAQALANHFGYSKALKPMMIFPFSSQRKLSAACFENEGTYILGAPEFVMPEMDVKTAKIMAEKASQGLRVVMIAHTAQEIKGERLPAGRKAIALICIEDHIRDDAVSTIKWFKDNDVAVKVISGDNPVTVSEVAVRVGVENADKYISLDGLSDQEVVEAANQYTVFGRVTPEQKRILIKSMKAKGNTVAMTGDGVNDILALKEADCSVAMATGSEAARNVSHMVLMDSNFSNMPKVVLEGRRVINNIQKSSSLFLMKTLFSILLSLIVIIIGNQNYPVTPRNLMMIEFFIIGVPSFFLAFQVNAKRIEGNFIVNVFKESVPSGIALVSGYMALYIFNLTNHIDPEQYKTMTVLLITFIGWVMLLRLCLPLNLYRGLLCAGSFIFCYLAVMLSIANSITFYPLFNVGKLDTINLLYTLVIIMGSYALSAIIGSIVKAIKIE